MSDNTHLPGQPSSRPWEFWPTLGLSLLMLMLLFLVGTVVSLCFIGIRHWQDPTLEMEPLTETMMTNGLLVSISTLVSGVLCTGLICLLIKLRPGTTLKGYLGLYRPRGRSLLIWNVLLVLFLLLAERIMDGLNQADDFIETAYQTAQIPGLLFIAVVIVAPIFEELLFRGFMFRGIQSSRLGSGGAIWISSAIWAGVHLQYNGYFMTVIFGLGMLLGAARAQTGSIYVPIAMHGLNNLIAFWVTLMFTQG